VTIGGKARRLKLGRSQKDFVEEGRRRLNDQVFTAIPPMTCRTTFSITTETVFPGALTNVAALGSASDTCCQKIEETEFNGWSATRLRSEAEECTAGEPAPLP
jgi:hypothetical protein